MCACACMARVQERANLGNDGDARPQGVQWYMATVHTVKGHRATVQLADAEQRAAKRALATP